MKNSPQKTPKKGSAKHIARLLSSPENLKQFAKACNIEPRSMNVVVPRRDDCFRERGNAVVLQRLGLTKYTQQLKEFWPGRGHHWDGVVYGKDGDVDVVLLIEAKAHIGEMNSSPMNRKTTKTVNQRICTLKKAAQHFGAKFNEFWTGSKYQTANRLAFAYFLSEVAKKPARVVYVLFTGDREIAHGNIATKEMWEKKFNSAIEDLGLPTDDSKCGRRVKSMLQCVIFPVEGLEQ